MKAAYKRHGPLHQRSLAENFERRQFGKRSLTGRANGTVDSWYGCDVYDEIIDYAVNFTFPWSEFTALCHLAFILNHLIYQYRCCWRRWLRCEFFCSVSCHCCILMFVDQVYNIPDGLNPEAPADAGPFLNGMQDDISRNLMRLTLYHRYSYEDCYSCTT